MSVRPPTSARREPACKRAIRGIGIVEIMVALALGLVIVAALGQLYSGSIKSHQVSYTMAQVGESGRFAVDLLATELRMAGYLSCGGADARIANTLDGGSNWLYQTGGIEGFEGGVDAFPAEFAGQTLPNTDMLILRRATLDLERKVVADDAGNAVLELGLDHGFQSGEILVVSDPACTQASVFQVTGLRNVSNPQAPNLFDAIEHDAGGAGTPGNCTRELFGQFDCSAPASGESGSFRNGSSVSRFQVAAYYVTNTDPPWLARMRLGVDNGNAVTVVENLVRNVEDFQVLYGLNSNQDGTFRVDASTTADQVGDWSEVVSVHFGLLLRSNDGGVRTESGSQSFALPGRNVVTPSDRYLRREFGNVVALRNVLP